MSSFLLKQTEDFKMPVEYLLVYGEPHYMGLSGAFLSTRALELQNFEKSVD